MTRLIALIVCGLVLSGCGFVHDEQLVGPYREVAVDVDEQMAVCESIGGDTDGNVICTVPATVFAVGYDSRFIIAKRHPFDEVNGQTQPDRSVTDYWIVRVVDKHVVGPLTEAAFAAERERLGVPSALKFSRFHDDLR